MESKAAAAHRLVDHRPGERLLQVDTEGARLIETTVAANPDADADAPFLVRRSVNGAEGKTIFSGDKEEAGRVLDAIAGKAAKVRSVNERVLAVLAAIGLAATGYAIGGLYPSRGDNAPAAIAYQPSADPTIVARVVPPSTGLPPVPETIGGPAAPTEDRSGIPPQAPPRTLASEPPRSTPPAIALPDGSKTAAATDAKAAEASKPSPSVSTPPTKAPEAAQAPQEGRLPSVAANDAPKASTVAQDGLAARAATAVANADAATTAARKDLEQKGAEAMVGEAEQLKRVVNMLSNGEKVTPEMVAQLPHEIAQRLRAAGVVLTAEENATVTKATTGREFRIVNLPPALIDRHRDADGVPTIPGANSWASTGGNVIIPLPGGGEIRSPDDLTAFNLQP